MATLHVINIGFRTSTRSASYGHIDDGGRGTRTRRRTTLMSFIVLFRMLLHCVHIGCLRFLHIRGIKITTRKFVPPFNEYFEESTSRVDIYVSYMSVTPKHRMTMWANISTSLLLTNPTIHYEIQSPRCSQTLLLCRLQVFNRRANDSERQANGTSPTEAIFSYPSSEFRRV